MSRSVHACQFTLSEELLTAVTTKIGVTKRIVAHSRVITRAVTQSSPLTEGGPGKQVTTTEQKNLVTM